MARCVIYNPTAGSAHQMDALQQRVHSEPDLMLCVTNAKGDAKRMAAEAAGRGDALVIAAGGDGTVNEIVNGLMTAGTSAADRPTLAILPLGTGNDLPRTLGIPLDPAEAVDLLDAGRALELDLIRVKAGGSEKYCANVAAGGFTGQLNEVLTDEMKDAWGPLAYLRGAVTVFPDLKDYHTRLRLDGGPWEKLDVFNVVCANGRYTGGGSPVAPEADPTDGKIDVVIVKRGTPLEVARLAAKYAAGVDYMQDDRILHRKVQRVEVQSTPGMWFNVDGELMGHEPATFTIIPAALRVLAGPTFLAS